jgi:hypothetical protein
MIAEKRGNGSKKRGKASQNTQPNYNNFNLSNLTTSTPEKQNQNLKGILNALNISTQSA